MGNFKSQKELVKAISANIDQLESGKLSLSELENHMNDVRELYERTVVLRYKIFEEKSDTTPENVVIPIIETPIEVVEEVKPIQFEEKENETPVIDFSLFDEDDDDDEQTPEVEIETEVAAKEIVVETAEEEKEEPEQIEVETPKTDSGAFNRLFSDVIAQTAGQFGFSKLDTLVGAFGLNERLQYINELFDGSSDVFSEAIKSLDSQANLEDAKIKTAQIAEENNWDLESDTVEEFIQKLGRRYA